jgi:hypothetical protein
MNPSIKSRPGPHWLTISRETISEGYLRMLLQLGARGHVQVDRGGRRKDD